MKYQRQQRLAAIAQWHRENLNLLTPMYDTPDNCLHLGNGLVLRHGCIWQRDQAGIWQAIDSELG